ncbi:hypothetical protein [Brevibacillus reuszeri]|uniref:hypothetical protein n=1 Tax=Brevibacillus reuszeri TaxID=54915 RepID=UPI003D23646F
MKNPDVTYTIRNTTVHIITPDSMSDEEKDKLIQDMGIAGWLNCRDLQEIYFSIPCPTPLYP